MSVTFAKMMRLLNSVDSLYYPEDDCPLPALVMLEPTNICNLQCEMCYVQKNMKKGHILSLENFQRIINQFPRIRELVFCGIGEPLLNKYLFSMIEAARGRGVDFINLFTNGKLLHEENIRNIIRSGIDRVQISVHSFNAKIFSKVRNEHPSNLEELKINIRRLVEEKRRAGGILRVCCNSVLNKFNYNELKEFIVSVKDLGADRVEFFQMTTAGGNLKEINAPLEDMGRIIHEARRFARRLGIEVGFLDGNEYGRCYQMWDFIMIHSNGDISPCNGIFPTENIGLGNILNAPIKEIWDSEKYRRLRQLVRNGRLEYCKYCESGYCLEGKNLRWFKNYYLRPLRRLVKAAYGR